MAVSDLDEYRAFAEQVIEDEEGKPTTLPMRQTRKRQMAIEMLKVYDQIECKRRLRALGKARAKGRKVL
jgi:hypothetical protein